MSRGRGRGRDDIFGFGDPFAGFGGFGGHGSLMPSLFGGRDPFDDPFFTRPFGGMFGSSMFGPSMFGSDVGHFGDLQPAGFLEHEAPPPKKSRGPIIEEINSDDEAEGDESKKEKTEGSTYERENPIKHSRSKERYVQDPDDEAEERNSRQLQYQNKFNSTNIMQPQTHSFSFQSSSVTYGGANGTYHTSSTSRRTGSDGLTMEESKEADTATGQAKHRLSRGIHDKGHTMTRKLNPDGRVDKMQTLHNLNEDEISGFEEAWKGNARKNLPGWSEGSNMYGNRGLRSSGEYQEAGRGGWALPATEGTRNAGRIGTGNSGARSNASRGKAKAAAHHH